MSGPLEIAVVGHTNAGKTSLLRTLIRRRDVGEVSPSPATTRRVEPIPLRVDGVEAIVLLDTPGLEDSIGLLEAVDAGEARTADRRADRIAALETFLVSAEAAARFPQECRALEAARGADLLLAVIDARDRVLPRHLDELELLGRCGRPVIPVLNFVASPQADAEAWRAALGRLGLHAVIAFDTVAYEVDDERRLFEAIRTLAPEHRDAIDRLLEARQRERDRRRTASARRIADLLIDAATVAVEVPKGREDDRSDRSDAALETLRARLRDLERSAHLDLLAIAGFDSSDASVADAALEAFDVGVDLFSPEAFKAAGFSAATGAAAGAATGAAIDLAVGGLSLGAAAALGAAIGGVLGAAGRHARRIALLARGGREVLAGDASLALLANRSIGFVQDLQRRGHASVEPLAVASAGSGPPRDLDGVIRPLRDVRSRFARTAESDPTPSVSLERARAEMAKIVETRIGRRDSGDDRDSRTV